MFSPKQRLALRYAGAVALTVAATLLRLALDPLLGDSVPFITYFLALIIAAWYGDFGPALLNLGLSILAVDYHILQPRGTLVVHGLEHQFGLGIFALVGLTIVVISGSMHSARRRALQAEAAERAQRQQWQVTLHSIGDAVIATDTAGRITFLNPVAESLTGWTREKAVGESLETVFRIVNEQTHQPAENPAAKVLRLGVVVGLANRTVLRTLGGSERPIDDSTAPIRDAAGNIIGVVLVFRDVSDRRKLDLLQREYQADLETKVKERTAQIRAAEERFRLLVEGTRDCAIFMLDASGNVASWNPGAERLNGYRADEIIGKHFSCFYPQADIASGKSERELPIAATAGKYEEEGVRVRKDGSEFWASVLVTALRGENGELRGFAKVTRDITVRRQAEEAARRLLQEEAARHAAEQYAQVMEGQREQLRVTLTSIGDGSLRQMPTAG